MLRIFVIELKNAPVESVWELRGKLFTTSLLIPFWRNIRDSRNSQFIFGPDINCGGVFYFAAATTRHFWKWIRSSRMADGAFGLPERDTLLVVSAALQTTLLLTPWTIPPCFLPCGHSPEAEWLRAQQQHAGYRLQFRDSNPPSISLDLRQIAVSFMRLHYKNRTRNFFSQVFKLGD